MKKPLKFTIYHALIISVGLHSAVALPILRSFDQPQDEIEQPIIELQAVVAETANEQKTLQETAGATKALTTTPTQVAEAPPVPELTPPPPPPPPEAPPPPPMQQQAAATPPPPVAPIDATPQDEPADHDVDEKVAQAAPATPQAETPPPPPPQPTPKASPAPGDGAKTATGTEAQQQAQKVKIDKQSLKTYAQALMKKVASHLVYPNEARRAGLHGTAVVSVTILANGQIDPASVKISESSGEPILDQNAIKTIQASAPFPSPPQPMTIGISLVFARTKGR